MKVFFVLFLLLLGGPQSGFSASPASQDAQTLMAKIERAEQNQQQILNQLALMKQELEIIKVRAGSKAVKKNG